MRFYNGTRASRSSSDKADRLLRDYMNRINRARRASEDYGGSTGGIKSLDGKGSGLRQIRTRQARQNDLRKIFKEEGSGRFGARKESFIYRMTDPGSEEREVAIRKQKGMSDDDEFSST
ncbi:MAG TPA: hypothetical protein DEP13_04645 [Gammaproteobacteria bacterium]|nr:MAG: hypothetical protein CBD74_01885 [Saprospirales bacterium TMED214]HCA35915.1 hypothetical protein [Gammaproteobacteria bacterium]